MHSARASGAPVTLSPLAGRNASATTSYVSALKCPGMAARRGSTAWVAPRVISQGESSLPSRLRAAGVTRAAAGEIGTPDSGLASFSSEMNPGTAPRIIVAGGGIGGLVLACAASQKVNISRSDPPRDPVSGAPRDSCAKSRKAAARPPRLPSPVANPRAANTPRARPVPPVSPPFSSPSGPRGRDIQGFTKPRALISVTAPYLHPNRPGSPRGPPQRSRDPRHLIHTAATVPALRARRGTR